MKRKKAEINGKRWMLAVRASMSACQPAERHLRASVHRRPASKFWHEFFREGCSGAQCASPQSSILRCSIETCWYLGGSA